MLIVQYLRNTENTKYLDQVSKHNVNSTISQEYREHKIPMQSVPITTKVVRSIPAHGKMYSIQHYVIKLSVTCDRSVVFSGYSEFIHQ
jgi:hypothetical protein